MEEGRRREEGGWCNEEEKEGANEEVEEEAASSFEIEGRKAIVPVYKLDDVSDLSEGRRSSSLSLCELSSSFSPSLPSLNK